MRGITIIGDGVKPLFRGTIAAILSGLVGVVHGGIDSSLEMPGFAHEVLTYTPAGLSAIVTATSKYGLQGVGERTGAGMISGGISTATTGAGYLIGRILVAGYKSISG